MSDSGVISPGQSYGSTGTGVLNTGSTNFNSGSAFDVDLNGTTAGSGYDQLNANGSVMLTGSPVLNLSIGPNFSASAGSMFIIINSSAGVSSGTFSGHAQGTTVTADGAAFTISYIASSSKEVVLTYLGPAGVTFSASTAANGTAMSAVALTGTLTNNSTSVTGLSSTSGLGVGEPVGGPGIPSGTTIATITPNAASSTPEPESDRRRVKKPRVR